ncbi:dUTP diphosphatase [Brazilian marseillevirus]|uniref:dCTP deaminase n=1 Tax=Brazilian marseillevirus TaxID=1813599 RepID=UPI0007813704|nr:dCTP deaminase [Brazilian marseillevirus]AMQ10575.1 dUTP diphosphatase [Brazilian marseillevirus]
MQCSSDTFLSVVQVKSVSSHPLPEYKTPEASGMDLHANLEEDVVLESLERRLIPTGLFIAMPEGMEAQIRPRSGLAFNSGITVLNAPGTVDSDFRGQLGVLLVNLSKESVTIRNGDRIAQIVFAPTLRVTWERAKELDQTKRGMGGFGSTGV